MTGSPQQPTTEIEPGESFPGLNWVKKQWARTRLGHEGLMLNRVQRVQRIGEVVARNAMTGQVEDTTGWPGEREGDAMGVEIGDRVVHNYYSPPEKKSKLAGTLGKAALAAALLGAGGGAGVGIPWLLGMFEKTPAAEQPPPVDVDREYELRLEIE